MNKKFLQDLDKYLVVTCLILKEKKFLIISDYYSKFPFVREIHSESTKTIINKMRSIFSEQRIPSTLYTDNGPYYSSADIKQFADHLGFKHTTHSPHYPQSNGFAERMVGIVKII